VSRYSRVSHLALTTCLVCEAESAPDMPFPICAPHAIAVFRRMQHLATEVRSDHHGHIGTHVAAVQGVHDERYAKVNSRAHQVYYIRIGSLIKIGTTKSLRARLANYPPGAELLAVERGGEDKESRRHRQFKHLLAERKEWFHPGADLLEHIERLNSKKAA
jgi:hypothetical protein